MSEYAPYSSKTEAIEEYKTLRAEILESQKQRVTLLQISLAAVVALFSYFMRDNALASGEALILSAVTTTAGLLTYSTRVRERRIANFIATFLGPLSPWSRMITKEVRLTFFQRSSTAMALVLLLLNAAFVTLAFPGWPRAQSKLDFAWIAAFVLAVVQLALLWKTTKPPDFTPAFREARMRMINAEPSSGPSSTTLPSRTASTEVQSAQGG